MGRWVTRDGATITARSGDRLGAPDPYTGDLEVILDVKDIATTASATQGSYDITVGSATGWTVGDAVILEDSWVRGTMGVGGAWPPRRYATLSAMEADTSQPRGTYAWIEATGEVRQWYPSWATGGTGYENTWWPLGADLYYFNDAVPMSLIATITGISGTTFTLDQPAQATKSGLNLYYDNHPLINQSANGISQGSIIIPDGEWWFSQGISIANKANVTFTGQSKAGTITRAPKGVPGLYMHGSYCNAFTVKDMTMKGNNNDTGFGFYRTSEATTTLPGLPIQVQTLYSQHPRYTNLRIEEPGHQGCNAGYAYDCVMDGVDVYKTDGYPMYQQWMLTLNDSSYSTIQNSSVECEELITAIEMFRCDHCYVLSNTTRNGLYSINACGTYTHDGNSCLIEANSKGDSHVLVTQCISVSMNVSPPASTFDQGGTISDFTLTVEGPTFTGDSSSDPSAYRFPKGINADTPCENVAVTGAYMVYAPGTLARGINMNGVGCSVTSSQVYGDDAGSYHAGTGANIYIENGPAVNCTARSVPAGPTGGSIDALSSGSSGLTAQYINLR